MSSNSSKNFLELFANEERDQSRQKMAKKATIANFGYLPAWKWVKKNIDTPDTILKLSTAIGVYGRIPLNIT